MKKSRVCMWLFLCAGWGGMAGMQLGGDMCDVVSAKKNASDKSLKRSLKRVMGFEPTTFTLAT